MELLTQIITSPLYLFLKEILPDGFDKQVTTFVGAYILLRFTVMKHFKLIETKFDTLNKTVKDGFEKNDQVIHEIQSEQTKIKVRVQNLEAIKH